MKHWLPVAAVIVVILAGLAIIGAWALSLAAPKQAGTAAAIAIPAAMIIFAALVWLGRRGQ